jgi:hypothetical protein
MRKTMHARTDATLERLDKANWFSCVGVKDTEAAIVLSSWQEATESCASLEWQNLCIEASNQYCERLVERSIERFKQWNTIVDNLKVITIPFVRGKVASVVRKERLPKIFEDMVQWDILHVCLEAEYADVYPPGFYASQAYWYVKGHFPCGWEGNFPEGKLIIY